MSVCNEGWSESGDEWDDETYCPVAIRYGGEGNRVVGCKLMLWHEWVDTDVEADSPPTTCPYVPILRVLMEAEGVATGNVSPIIIYQGEEPPYKWEKYWFWIRRRR